MSSFWLTVAIGVAVVCGEPLIEHVDEKSGAVWRSTGRRFSKSKEHLKQHLGSLPMTPEQSNVLPVMARKQFNEEDLPKNFDARKHWPQCEMIKFIWDQGACKSGWAVSAVSAMSDRLCIHKDIHVQLSVTDVLSCCTYCGSVCKFGYAIQAWEYYNKSGLVTGGDGATCQGCQCYPYPRCGERKNSDIQVLIPACVKKCRKEYPKQFQADKYYGQRGYHVRGTEADIRHEIMTNGPIQAAFYVMEDFETYHSGIYFHEWGGEADTHQVRVIGWGEENGTAYWLVANSRCTNWGENGLFRIVRGTDECGFESYMLAGMPS